MKMKHWSSPFFPGEERGAGGSIPSECVLLCLPDLGDRKTWRFHAITLATFHMLVCEVASNVWF